MNTLESAIIGRNAKSGDTTTVRYDQTEYKGRKLMNDRNRGHCHYIRTCSCKSYRRMVVEQFITFRNFTKQQRKG